MIKRPELDSDERGRGLWDSFTASADGDPATSAGPTAWANRRNHPQIPQVLQVHGAR